MQSNPKRIGVYGGTFDPIHNAHLKVIRAALLQFDLNELLVVPSFRPPHKSRDAVLDAYQRYAMAVLATVDVPRAFVSTMELAEPGRPYTFETIQRLRGLVGPAASIFFIMGMDSYVDFPDWKSPNLILMESNLIVVTRGADATVRCENSRTAELSITRVTDLRVDPNAVDVDHFAKRGAVFITNYETGELSSSEVRTRVRASEQYEDLVPDRVAEYIKKYGLYLENAEAQYR